MATDLEILSLTHHPIQPTIDEDDNKRKKKPSATAAWMWNTKRSTDHDDDDSWEVKAFEQDTTGNIMGTTWPPRSYTCTFCRREFRSAQALGGHMNVHRRDRARLHQAHPQVVSAATTSSSIGASNPNHSEPANSSTLLIPTHEFPTGLCLLYQLPNHNGGVFASVNGVGVDNSNPPSTLLSISPYLPHSNAMNFPVAAGMNKASHIYGKSLESSSGCDENVSNDCYEDSAMGELDLELRLGHSPTTPSRS